MSYVIFVKEILLEYSNLFKPASSWLSGGNIWRAFDWVVSQLVTKQVRHFVEQRGRAFQGAKMLHNFNWKEHIEQLNTSLLTLMSAVTRAMPKKFFVNHQLETINYYSHNECCGVNDMFCVVQLTADAMLMYCMALTLSKSQR